MTNDSQRNKEWLTELRRLSEARSRLNVILGEIRADIDSIVVAVSVKGARELLLACNPNQFGILQYMRDLWTATRFDAGPTPQFDITLNATFNSEIVIADLGLAGHFGTTAANLVVVYTSMISKEILDDLLRRFDAHRTEMNEIVTYLHGHFPALWHRQARRTLLRTEGNVDGMISKLLNSKEENTPAALKQKIAERYLKILVPGMQLSYAAILLRDGVSRDYFDTVAELGGVGLGKDITGHTRFHIPGQGLIGKQLENGNRFYQQNGASDDFVRRVLKSSSHPVESGEEIAVSTSAIRSSDDSCLFGNDAMLVCIRRSRLHLSRLYFSEDEHNHLISVADSVARGFDRLNRAMALNSEIQFSDSLCAVWESRKPLATRVSESLALVCERLPFSRILFAKVISNEQRVMGLACVGFSEDLVVETQRVVENEGWAIDEDILAKAVKERWYEPRILPALVENGFAMGIDVATATRQGLRGSLAVMAIAGKDRSPIAVLLAETVAAFNTDYAGVLGRLAHYSRQIAAKYRLAILEECTNEKEESLNCIADTLNREFSSEVEPLQTLVSCIEHVGGRLNASGGVALLVNEELEEFQLVASWKVFEKNQVEVAFPLPKGTDLLLDSHDLVSRAFLSQHPVNGLLSDCFPNDLIEKRYCLPDECSSQVLPITFGPMVVGVFILFDSRMSVERVSTIGDRVVRIAAVTFSRVSLLRQSQRLRSELSSLEGVIRGMQLFHSERFGDRKLAHFFDSNQRQIETILRFICSFFRADNASFFSPDDALSIPASDGISFIDNLSSVSFNFRKCWGLSAAGIESTARASFTAFQHSLRSAVVRSMRVLTSPDATSDNRRSRLYDDILAEKGTTPWSWMGIPVMVRDASNVSLYGVITVMRKRASNNDCRQFTERNKQAAELISSIVAMGLHHTNSSARHADNVSKQFRYFGHHVKGPLTSSTGMLENLRYNLSVGSSIEVPELKANIDELSGFISFASGSVNAYFDFFSGSTKWEAEETSYSVATAIDDVLKVLSKRLAGISVDTSALGQTCFTNVDRERLTVVLHSLMENAIRATLEKNASEEKKVMISCCVIDTCVRVMISDSGPGLPKNRTLDELMEFGTSLFGGQSTGIGLAMVTEFMRGLEGGEFDLKSLDNGGACATVCIPICVDKEQ